MDEHPASPLILSWVRPVVMQPPHKKSSNHRQTFSEASNGVLRRQHLTGRQQQEHQCRSHQWLYGNTMPCTRRYTNGPSGHPVPSTSPTDTVAQSGSVARGRQTMQPVGHQPVSSDSAVLSFWRIQKYMWMVLVVFFTLATEHGGLVRAYSLANNRQQQQDEQGLREYCEWESFNATCGRDEVIVMRTAKYGRMRLGRCVTKNYGHIGCGTDVLAYMESQCSGRRHCLVNVISLHNKRSCPKDFKSYLQASYVCRKVMHPRGAELGCPANGHQGLSATSGCIASVTTEETGLGSPRCPWRIQVAPHQRINLTLIEFNVPSSSTHHLYSNMDNSYLGQTSSIASTKCDSKYAVISEKNKSRTSSVCGGRSRETNVFLSETNVVEVVIPTVKGTSVPAYFLLKYEAFGCPPIVPPANAWIQSDVDHAIVQCNDTEETWFLTCDVTEWVGQVGNCSHITVTESPWTISDMFKGVSSFPFGLLIVVALGVAIGVAVGLVMLVTVLAYMKRRRRRKVRSRSNYLLKNVIDVGDGQQAKPNAESATDCSPMLVKRENLATSLARQRDYACNTWHMKRQAASLGHPDGGCGGGGSIGVGGGGVEAPGGGGGGGSALVNGEGAVEGLYSDSTQMVCNATLPRVFTTFKPSEQMAGEGYESPHSEREGYILKAIARDTEGPYYFKLDHISSMMDAGADLTSPDGHKPDLVPGCIECQERTHMQSCQSIV